MVKLLMPLALLVALVVTAVWSDKPMPAAELTIVERSEVNSTDPAQMSWTQDFRLGRAIFEGLLRPTADGSAQRLEPAAAEAMPEVSADRKTYTFRIRKDARWSNGDLVTSADFVYAWRRMLLPETGADYTQMLTILRGAAAWAKSREEAIRNYGSSVPSAERARKLYDDAQADFERTVGIRTPDARTLVVELERPVPYFLELVAFVPFYPVHARSVAAYESIDAASGRVQWAKDWTKPPNLISNGPYRLAAWRFKRDMRLERNPFYWDPSLPKSASVAILNIADPNTMVMSFRGGGVDLVTDVVVPYRADMLSAKRTFRTQHGSDPDAASLAVDSTLPSEQDNRIHAFPTFGTYFLNVYCGKELSSGRPNPFADARVRRALAMAVDKDEIARDIRRCGERPAGALIPPGSIQGYQSPKGLLRDPEAARRELAAAGFPGGAGLPTIEFLYSRDGSNDLIAQAVKRTWERELGVTVTLAQVESRVFGERVQNGRYMVSRANWFGDYGDPTTFLDISRRGNNNNDRKFENEEFERLMARSDDEPDAAKRMELLAEAERLIVERELPLIPLFHHTQIYQFDATRLRGVSDRPMQTQLLYLMEATR